MFKRNLVPGFWWLIALWGFIAFCNLAFWGGIIYVAAHFISKYW